MTLNPCTLLAIILAGGLLCAAEPTLLGRTAADWSNDLESSDELVRAKSAWALSQMGEFDRLKKSIHHKDPAVRVWMVRGIAAAARGADKSAPRDKGAREMLLERLQDGVPSVCLAAAESLLDLEFDRQRALAALAKLLDHPNDQIRHHALLALDKPIDLDPAILEKITQMRNDPYEYAKRVALAITKRHRKEQP
jgi:HEAT repeat protein